MKKTCKCDPLFLKIAVDVMEINDYFCNELPGVIKNAAPAEVPNMQNDLRVLKAKATMLLDQMEKMKVSCKDKYKLLNMVQSMVNDSDKYLCMLNEKSERSAVIKEKPVDDNSKVIVKTGIKISTSLEDRQYTTLNCRYTTSPKYNFGWWVNIYNPSYLVDMISGKRIEMISAFNIPLSPERHYLKSFGASLSFTLVFPQVPKDWLIFKFIEGGSSENALSSGPIARNEGGVYNVNVS